LGWEAQLARRNLLRSWLAAALSVVAVMAAGLLMVRPVPAGAADTRRLFTITVSDSGFNPPVVPDANVGDILMFALDSATEEHTVTFEDNSVCPGSRGAVPCWPELRFDDGHPNCVDRDGIKPGHRCMIVQDPGKTVLYHDAFNVGNGGEIRVLGQATTTTGPSTTTTTASPSTTTTTQPPTTSTTWSQTTNTTAPTQIRPFVIPDPGPTTSTMAPAAPVAVTNTGGTPAPTTNKNKDKDKGKAKAKAAGTETPTTASAPPPDAMPPDSVFDPAALTPGPVLVPDTPGNADGRDEVDLESAAVMNLLDHDEASDHRPLLLALAALAFLLTVGGLWHWLHRASRYDPA
jgi:hypothetical protein